MGKIISTILIVAVFLGPPILALIANRLDPNIATALGVPYASLLGLALGALFTLSIFLISKRWPNIQPHYGVVAAGCLLALLLFPLADRGLISVIR